MPRIGPKPILPPAVQQAPAAERASTQKAAAQAPTHATEEARTQQAKKTQQSALTSKARGIAKRLADGELSQKEATREFVGLVIEERFPAFKKKKKRKKKDEEGLDEQLEEAVTELIDQDPALAKRLSQQLRQLSKK